MSTQLQLAAQQSYSQHGSYQNTIEYDEMIWFWNLEEEAAERERGFWGNHNASDYEHAEAAHYDDLPF
jgi:hypothetical protein